MKITIAGAGQVGSHLAKMLCNEGNDICVVDPYESRLAAIRSHSDVLTVEGNPTSIETLRKAGCENADLFIAVNPGMSQDANIVCALLAKRLGTSKVTARIDNEEYLSFENKFLFTEMGIDLLFYPEKIAAGEIQELLKKTASAGSIDFARGKLHLAVFKIEEDSPLLDKKLIDFIRETQNDSMKYRVVAIARNNDTIMPRPDTRFKYHDLVFIISKRDGIDALIKKFGKSNFDVDSVMILGGSPIGEMVAKQMCSELSLVKIIEQDKERCDQLSENLPNKVTIVNGDGRNSDLLIEESISNFDAFVAVTGSSETNILACVAAKKLGVPRTIAQVENIEYIRLAENMGVDAVINKKLITAGRIFKFTLSDKVRSVKYMSGTNAEVIEFVVAPGSRITKAPLKDINFPKNAIIGGVIRGNESFIAVGDSQIKDYDRVAVFALPEVVKEVDKFFK